VNQLTLNVKPQRRLLDNTEFFGFVMATERPVVECVRVHIETHKFQKLLNGDVLPIHACMFATKESSPLDPLRIIWRCAAKTNDSDSKVD